MNKFNKYFFNRLNLNLFFIIFLVVTIIPLNLSYASSSAYDLNLIFSLLIITFILFFIFTTFTTLINWISKKFNIYQLWFSLISFVLFWIFVTGIFTPITGNHDPFFNLSLSISKKYEIIIKTILITILFFILKKKDTKNLFFRFIYFFLIFNFIFNVFNSQKNISKDVNIKLSHFGKKNLIVLSFDGISGHKINEEILNNFDLKNNLKDFKFYKNTISGAPFTWPSMNIELNGKFEEPGTNEYYRNILNQDYIDTLTYNYYNFASDKKRAIYMGEYRNYNNNFKTNKFIQEYFIGSVGRWASPLGVFAIENLKYINIYKKFLNLVFKNKNEDINPFLKVDSVSHLDLFEYDIIFENIKKDITLDNVIRMYHFGFTHWPVVVNENCEEVMSLNKNIKAHDHEKIILKCVSKKIVKFINNLKKHDVYNNSMIVIKSDHAKPNYEQRSFSESFSDFFEKKQYDKFYKKFPYNQKINNSFYWGYGRYKPFIMIKGQNQIGNDIEISDKQVFLHDLSKTYCDYFLVKDKCGYSKRNNLNFNENEFENYNYNVYLPEQKYTSSDFYALKKYEISSNTSFLEFFKINKITLSD